MNVVFHKTDNILTLVIHLTVYIAVRDAPASAKLQHLSGETSMSIQASWLSIQSSIPCVSFPHVSHIFFGNGFQSLIHFHECFSLDTNKLHKLYFFVGYENMEEKIHCQKVVTKSHQMSSNVRCGLLEDFRKRRKKQRIFISKSTKFIPDRTIRPFQVKRYGIDNQCNGAFVGIALWMYGRYWRKTCGKVLCQYAAACGEREDREKLMRYAIIAGNPYAPPVVCLDLSGTV